MKIKKFNDFVNEAISGVELIGPMGPGYGETGIQNKTLNRSNTSLVGSDLSINKNSKNGLTDSLFSEDDYVQLHIDYLKAGGSESELSGDFESDIETMSYFLGGE